MGWFGGVYSAISSSLSTLEGSNLIDKFESSTIYEENKKKIELIRQEMNKREEKPFVQKNKYKKSFRKKDRKPARCFKTIR